MRRGRRRDVVAAESLRRRGIGAALPQALLGGSPPTAVVPLFRGAQLTELREGVGFRATRQVLLHRDPVRGP